jgi:hypothetical protein
VDFYLNNQRVTVRESTLTLERLLHLAEAQNISVPSLEFVIHITIVTDTTHHVATVMPGDSYSLNVSARMQVQVRPF